MSFSCTFEYVLTENCALDFLFSARLEMTRKLSVAVIAF